MVNSVTVTLPKHSDQNSFDTWNLSTLFPSWDVWHKEIESLQDFGKTAVEFEGKLTSSPQVLLRYLHFDAEVSSRYQAIELYARLDALQNNLENENEDRVLALLDSLIDAMQFEQTELQSLSPATLDEFCQQEPELKQYQPYLLEKMPKKAMLSELDFNLLRSTNEIRLQAYKMKAKLDPFSGECADSLGQIHTVSHHNISNLLLSEDKKLREGALEIFENTISPRVPQLADIASVIVSANECDAKLKHLSVLEMMLANHSLDVGIYETATKVFFSSASIWKSYFKKVASGRKISKLKIIELRLPIVPTMDKLPPNDLQHMVESAFGVLGSDLLQLTRKIFQEKWIRFGPNISSDLAWHVYNPNPFSQVGFAGTYFDASLVAHEIGHIINFYLSSKKMPFQTYSCDTFIGECIANTFQYLFLEDLIFGDHSNQTRLQAIGAYGQIYSAHMFFQTLWSIFENKVYSESQSGKRVNETLLNQTIEDYYSNVLGEDIGLSDSLRHTWAKNLGSFLSGQYSATYNPGAVVGSIMAHKIRQGEIPVDEFMDLLSKGSLVGEADLLKFGIDLKNPETHKASLQWFSEIIENTESV